MGGFKERRCCSSEQAHCCWGWVCQTDTSIQAEGWAYPGNPGRREGAGRKARSRPRGCAGPDRLISCKTTLLSELSSSDPGKTDWVGQSVGANINVNNFSWNLERCGAKVSKLLQRSPGWRQCWAEAGKLGLWPNWGTRVCLNHASLELLVPHGPGTGVSSCCCGLRAAWEPKKWLALEVVQSVCTWSQAVHWLFSYSS